MQSMTGNMLIDFQNLPISLQEKQYHKQVHSAIKLHMSQMQKYEQIQHFTQCSKCKVILIEEDRNQNVYQWEEIQSNPKEFKDILQNYHKQDQVILWICGFCNHQNVIPIHTAVYAPNNTRVIERPAVHNLQKKQPILLIVFDISGSMQEELKIDQKSMSVIERFRNTKIYKKIVAEEEREIQEILLKDYNFTHNIQEENHQNSQSNERSQKHQNLNQSNQNNQQNQNYSNHKNPNQSIENSRKNQSNSKNNNVLIKPPHLKHYKYVDYLKKNKLLMGITEWLINQTKNVLNQNNQEKAPRNNSFEKFSSVKDVQKSKLAKNIGFMFFNSNIYMQFGSEKGENKNLIIADNADTHASNSNEEIKEKADFQSFQSLFKLGAMHGHNYNTKLVDFDFNNLGMKFNNNVHGQTALGPALVTALGVISKHGAGSSIVVVTDGIANKGIFGYHYNWDDSFRLLKMKLEKHKCFLAILECRNVEENKKEISEETELDKFCQRHEDTIARKINILINKNKSTDLVEDIKKKMIASINRENVIWTNYAQIKCQHPLISYEKDSQNLTLKLHNQKEPLFINPKFDQTKLREKDYMRHFVTQAIIKYQNTQTGEQSTFMTYILQKFIKYHAIKKKTMKSLDNQKTMLNMMEYLSSEQQQLSIRNLPLSCIKQSFRASLSTKSICQKSIRNSIRHDGYSFKMSNERQEEVCQKNEIETFMKYEDNEEEQGYEDQNEEFDKI